MRYLLFLFIPILFTLSTSSARGYTPKMLPIYPVIDSVLGDTTCLKITPSAGLIYIEIICDNEEFVFYSATGQLDTTSVLTKEDGKSVSVRLEPRTDCDTSQPVLPGQTLCDEEQLKKSGNGTVLKTWNIRLKSVSSENDVIIKGKTVYDERMRPLTIQTVLNAFINIALGILFSAAAILTALKVIWKKKIHSFFIALPATIAIFLLLFYLLGQVWIG